MGKSTSAKSLRVIHFERRSHPGGQSIERLFREIRGSLPGTNDVTVVSCPTPANGRFWFLQGVFQALRSAGDVNHVVGDQNYVAFALPPARTILTIHDLLRLDRLTGFRKRVFTWIYFTVPLRRCRFITAISESTRDRLIELFPEVAGKIRVIHNCLPLDLLPRARVFNKVCPRILQVGTAPNKNLERLIQALAGERCLLHVVGRLTDGQTALMQECGIHYVNHFDLTDEAMREAYEAADMVVFASLAEGFGLPIIEANAVGRAVVTSDLSPMKDVAGNAARLVDPFSVCAMKAGIRDLIDHDRYREDLIENGYINVKRFSVRSVAAQYEALYQEVVESSGLGAKKTYAFTRG